MQELTRGSKPTSPAYSPSRLMGRLRKGTASEKSPCILSWLTAAATTQRNATQARQLPADDQPEPTSRTNRPSKPLHALSRSGPIALPAPALRISSRPQPHSAPLFRRLLPAACSFRSRGRIESRTSASLGGGAAEASHRGESAGRGHSGGEDDSPEHGG